MLPWKPAFGKSGLDFGPFSRGILETGWRCWYLHHSVPIVARSDAPFSQERTSQTFFLPTAPWKSRFRRAWPPLAAPERHFPAVTLRVLRVKIVPAECGPSRSLRRVRSSRNQLQDGPKAAPCPPYATRTTCRAEEPASIDATALNRSSAGARSFAGDAVAFDEE